MIELSHIERRLQRLNTLEEELADPAVLSNNARLKTVMREHTSLKRLQEALVAYDTCLKECSTLREMVSDSAADDEMCTLAQAELIECEAQLPEFEHQLLLAMLPEDPADNRNALFEIRAGTGGDEATIFVSDLFRMYSRTAEEKGLKISLIDSSTNEIGGYKEILFTVVGENAYKMFRYESGGHRVQRVPLTESQGRIHTSAATVAVFPEVNEEDDIDIPVDDLRIDIFCASGHGGQGVNTTYSAIRITHLPTGLVAQCQDERSQHRNKEKALNVLKARLLDLRRQEEESKLGQTRRDMIGSGDRSQRIRTYNFPQNRMTDHRIGLTLYNLDRMMDGDMDELLETLQQHSINERLAAAALT